MSLFKLRSGFNLAALAFGLSLLFISNIFAQTQGGLSGVVTDTNGAAVSGASVKLVSKENGAERTATANTEGIYSLQQLAPGTYTVTVVRDGFKASQIKDLTVAVGQPRELNVMLETGEVTALVNIASNDAEPAVIDQSSNRLGSNISAREVAELPFSETNVGQFGVINGTIGRTVGFGTNRQIQFALRLNF